MPRSPGYSLVMGQDIPHSLRCPFCKLMFPAGQEWRDHFLVCPRREGGEPSQGGEIPMGLSLQIKAIESRMAEDQQTIERLRDRIKSLERENRLLQSKIDGVRRELDQ